MRKVLATSALIMLCCLGWLGNGLHIYAQSAVPPEGTFICDVAYTDCRAKVLSLIRKETVGIDLSYWFITDARYTNEIVKRWQAGLPVRVIMDSRASASKPSSVPQLNQLRDAGIPLVEKPFGDVAHWKGMIFAGQQVVEFSGANYSPYEYVYEVPFVNYEDEAIYFSTEPDVVRSLMRRFDDVWVDPAYTVYANPIARVRNYPTSYTIAPEFNLPPTDSYTNRLLPLLDAERQAIDVVMFRITDPRPTDALIRAETRGVPVRLYAEPSEYRNAARRDDAYQIDRMYVAGVEIRMRAHAGLNHQKTVLLAGQGMAIFGTSNWSTASDDNQLEVNYFTTKNWFYQFFVSQFAWKWSNRPPDGSTAVQTTAFVPLDPASPSYRAPANLATQVSPTSVTLRWYAGDWARKYDVYLGPGANPPLYQADAALGPSTSTTDNKSLTVTGLLQGTTYSWRVVSKTMANVVSEGPLWRFTTSGTPPEGPPPSPADVTAPFTWIYAPQNNATTSESIQILASASDNVGVAAVQFKVDGISVGAEDRSGPFSIPFDTRLVSNGVHTLTVQARDSAGNTSTSNSVRITVSNTEDTTPPTVSLAAPASGSTVEGVTTESATGSDDVGIAGIQFKLDGVNLGGEVTAAPYSRTWYTVLVANGEHSLTALARDVAGNTAAAAPITVTVSNTPPPPPPPTGTVVLRAADVPLDAIFGNWIRSVDSTAADGVALWNPDNGVGKVMPAPEPPQNYVEITFNAQAATPYHLWIRMRAQNNFYGNDSIHVQFSDAVDAAGSAIYRMGTTGDDNSAKVALQETDGGIISGWGWADQAWNGLASPIYFSASGTHTIRIQQREDGVMFDQIVLSPDTYLTTPPGRQNGDNTIVPR